MALKHRPQVQFPNIQFANGSGTQQVFTQLMKMLSQSLRDIYDDLVNLTPSRASALPTASAEYLGRFFIKSNAGAADTLHFCIFEDVTQTYIWKAVTLT